MSAKLIVLGIDAGSPALLRRWIDEGKLPAIGALVDRGMSGTVAGVEGLFVGSTWPTFYTGVLPGRHGIYRIQQIESGTYGFFRPFDRPDGIGGSPFWRLASRAGRRVAVLDVPLSQLESDLNGIQTVEWGGHDAVYGFRTSPPELAEEIRSEIGPYPLPSDCNATRRTAADFESFVAGLETAVTKRTDLTLRVLKRERWDLLVQVFTEAHCAGHQCWHIHDPTHPAHDAELMAALGDPLERVYRAIDAGVGAVLDHAGDGTVLLFSAHGMSHFRGANFLLPEILRRLGVTHPPQDSKTRAMELLRTASRLLSDAAVHAIRALRKRTRVPRDGHGSVRADLTRSPCFPIPNGFPVSGIRLNLAGREPNGVLEPGSEANEFCRDLARDLLEIVDLRTGSPLVERVLRTRELYDGPRCDALPDLLVVWNATPTGTLAHGDGRNASVRASSPRIGTVEGTNRWVRTGEHVPDGFFVLAGPGLPHGRREPSISLVDLHPTLCRLMEISDPDVDGTPIPEVAAWAT
jgi:predicted AlkP superfamily phosphohydrolase/phosphomutase